MVSKLLLVVTLVSSSSSDGLDLPSPGAAVLEGMSKSNPLPSSVAHVEPSTDRAPRVCDARTRRYMRRAKARATILYTAASVAAGGVPFAFGVPYAFARAAEDDGDTIDRGDRLYLASIPISLMISASASYVAAAFSARYAKRISADCGW